jgi:hypothetical protein
MLLFVFSNDSLPSLNESPAFAFMLYANKLSDEISSSA